MKNLKTERDSITSTLQLTLTKADSQQLLRKIAEDQVGVSLTRAGDYYYIYLDCAGQSYWWMSLVLANPIGG